jgi:hypothetical protein
MLIEQYEGVKQCLNVVKLCKPFLSNALLIMTSLNDIVKTVTDLNSNVLTNALTIVLTTNINQSNVRLGKLDKFRQYN